VRHGLDTSFLVAVEVACDAEHAVARSVAETLLRNDDRFVIAPQVVAEFVHIVTDARRFSAPLTIERAMERAEIWWNAKDVDRVLPDERTVTSFLAAMTQHQLCLKRVLDTFLAGTFRTAAVSSILTLNPEDFRIFGEFACVPLGPVGG
jgi:predicted nucleic acid-binding protein